MAPYARAQSAAAQSAIDGEDTIVLSPFVIESSEESDGYAATSTLAGTRIRTDLKDLAAPISVITKQFLQDTAATNNQDLLVYTPSTEVTGLRGNYSGQGGGQTYNESLGRPNTSTRVRGLDAADNTRDYFLTEISWDSYNVDRVDLQRGPNSILFGLGSPAGIINASVNTAMYRDQNEVEVRLDQEGSVRSTADFNKVLIEDQLAVRLSILDDHTNYQQKPAFKDDRRFFGTVKWEPRLLGAENPTMVRVNYEHGEIDANYPRSLPPVDYITPWFNSLNKMTVDPGRDRGRFAQDGTEFIPWFLNEAFKGNQYNPDLTPVYTDPGARTLADVAYPGERVNDRAINSAGEQVGGIADQASFRNFAIAQVSQWARRPEAGVAGGQFYGDFVMTDTSVFDFYNLLLDGPNKAEWEDWDASNVSLSQSLFNNRLNLEAVYDYQRYFNGNVGSGFDARKYGIQVDVNSHLFDGSPNPNVGRPYVAAGAGGYGWNASKRDAFRYSAVGEFRGSDFFGEDSKLASIIGRHLITGIYSTDTRNRESRNWSKARLGTEWPATIRRDNAPSSQFEMGDGVRTYDWTVYLGDSLLGASSPQNAHISNLLNEIYIPDVITARYFDATWIGDQNGVLPDDPYTYVNALGETQESTQSENSANYVGYRNKVIDVLRPEDGDIDLLRGGGNKTRTITDSQAITWQGYLFDGALAPTFGWRKDKIKSISTPSPRGSLNEGIIGYENVELADGTNSQVIEGESKSWGIVAHLPDSLAESLPFGSGISAFYNKGENFSANAPRADVRGNVLDNPTASTTDYGVVLRTLNDKISLKVNHFETEMQNANLPVTNAGFGGSAYYLWAIPSWATTYAVASWEGINGRNPQDAGSWNYAARAARDAGDNTVQDNDPDWQPGTPNFDNSPATVQQRAALIDFFTNMPLGQDFWDAYGMDVNYTGLAGIPSGGSVTTAWPGYAPNGNKAIQPSGNGNILTVGSAPVATSNTLSKGWEYELTAQPIPNWNISINASKTFATVSAVSPSVDQFIEEYTEFLAGPAGDIRLWGTDPNNSFRNYWQREILSGWAVQKSLIGQQVPEMAEWRYNAVSTYRFEEGPLKNTYIGGAWRHEGKRIIGYKYDATTDSLDVANPWYSTPTNHVDMWLGYSRQLSEKIDWRIQLNLRNVGESDHLVPAIKNPDGDTTLYRIQQGLGWQLSNSFTF